MTRKAQIWLVCALLALLVGAGLWFAFSRPSGEDVSLAPQVSAPALFEAVPSDAAMVFCFRDLRDAVKLFSNPRTLLRPLLGDNAAFFKFIDTAKDSLSLKARPTVISVHYSGSLSPLMVVDCGHSQDTSSFTASVLERAASLGLYASLKGVDGTQVLILSPSQTIALASERHLDTGVSVLEDSYFKALAGKTGSSDALFVNHSYIDNIATVLFRRPAYKSAFFLSRAAEWTALKIGGGGAELAGWSETASPSQYADLVSKIPDSRMLYSRVLPGDCVWAVALGVPDYQGFLKDRARWLDANQSLQAYGNERDALSKSSGTDPEEWFASLGVREVVKGVRIGDNGEHLELVFVRVSKPSAFRDGVACQDFPALVFGDGFKAGSGAVARMKGDWLWIGDEAAIASFGAALDEAGPLVLPSRNSKLESGAVAVYFSPSACAPYLKDRLKPAMEKSVRSFNGDSERTAILMDLWSGGVLVDFFNIEKK